MKQKGALGDFYKRYGAFPVELYRFSVSQGEAMHPSFFYFYYSACSSFLSFAEKEEQYIYRCISIKGEKKMEEEKEEKGKEQEESTSLRVSRGVHERVITLQSLRQIREKKRLTVSEILTDALNHRIEKMRKGEK